MIGTEKQIAWATKLQAKQVVPAQIAVLDQVIAKAKTAQAAEEMGLVREILSNVATEESASWWIDNAQFEADFRQTVGAMIAAKLPAIPAKQIEGLLLHLNVNAARG